MAVEERDPHTGYMTTGHEWNGITELNTPVPRAVYFFLIVTALFAVVYWLLMPAWPLWSTYTRGLLGSDQRIVVAESLQQAALDRAAWVARIESAGFAEIQSNPGVMEVVRQTGRTLFGDNCAACHGRDGKGRAKVVRYWEMTITEGEFVPNDEVDEIRWLDVDGAESLLTYERDRVVLECFRQFAGVQPTP